MPPLSVLGIVTARGGSKGLPRKNLAPVLGRPLLAYTAEAALQAKRLSRVVLSTDDVEIANAGQELGLDVQDKIAITAHTHAHLLLAEALHEHAEYIKSETQALHIQPTEHAENATTHELDDEFSISLHIAKA